MKTDPKLKNRILAAYIDSFKEKGVPPVSAYTFCKSLKITEKSFYQEFPSLEAVEKVYWQNMIKKVIAAIERGGEWKQFTSKQQLLVFLYAFFEEALDHRTLLLVRMRQVSPMEKPACFSGFESVYKDFIRRVLKKGVETKEIAARGKLQAFYPELFYFHLRAVIDFNLKDASEGYERTDALIEKSVTFIFDLLRTSAIESGFDLGKMFISMMRRANCADDHS